MESQHSSPTRQFKITPKLIIIGIGLLLAIVILISWLLWVKYPSYTVSTTPLNTDRNFSHMTGSDIYSYNGMAFYKINLAKNNEVAVLSEGLKLPTPKNVFWADSRGALVSFDESFILTEVEKALAARGQVVDEITSTYTWYLDFSSSTLSLVSEEPLLTAVFSARDNGFYYIPDYTHIETDSYAAPNTPLHFYNINTKADETVSEDLEVVDITHIGNCSDASMKVCIIASDKDNIAKLKLIGINSQNQTVPLIELDEGKLVATNSPDLYVTATPSESDKPATSGSADGEREIAFTNMRVELRNIKTKTATSLPFTIDEEDIFPYIVSDKDFYVLSTRVANENQANVFINGAPSTIGIASSTESPLTFSDGKLYNTGIAGIVGYGDNGTSLLDTNSGMQLLFSPSAQSKTVDSLSKKSVEDIVNKCATGAAIDYFDEEKQFRVLFTDNDAFKQTVATFSDCVTKADTRALVGYNFAFGARDPGSGRITTD